MTLPRAATELLEWLSIELSTAFAAVECRRASISLSRSDRRRLLALMEWLRRNGHVAADAFTALPGKAQKPRKRHGPFPRGRCTACGRDVAVGRDGKARPHRGSEKCRNGGQDVTPAASMGEKA